LAQKSRENEIIESIRKYLVGAVQCPEPITDERLMKAAKCGRTTFYKYVTKGSEIELEIQTARAEQQKYIESITGGDGDVERKASSRERLERAEAGARELLAFFARMTANLQRFGVSAKIIQAAQSEALPHPDRSFSHAGRGRRRK
jgi:hypothetical protein